MDNDNSLESLSGLDFDKTTMPTSINLNTIKSVCIGQLITATAKVFIFIFYFIYFHFLLTYTNMFSKCLVNTYSKGRSRKGKI